MKSGRVAVRCLVVCLLLAVGWAGESAASVGGSLPHLLSFTLRAAATDYASCQWATPPTQDSWIRTRYLNQGDFALLGCPITPELMVPGQTDGRYTYQRFEKNNKCIAWNWSKASVWTSPGNYEEMDCGQVQGLQSTPATGTYYSCQWATPSSQDSWIRTRYLNQGDFALLGCPITPELVVPGQTDGRYTYQRFEKSNKCIAWNWNKADVWTSPGNYEEMDCGQVKGLQPPTTTPSPKTPRPSPGCGITPVPVDLSRRTVNSLGRSYFLHVPSGASSTTPQKLIFVWHGCNGSVSFIRSANALDLETNANAANDKAIFVYPQANGSSADPNANEGCFSGAGEIPFFDQMVTDIGNAYCIDLNRVFSTGYSSGGIVSTILGCQRYGAVRGIATVEGGIGVTDNTSCPGAGKVDAFVIHNPRDEQIGWATSSPGWPDGRGVKQLRHFYDSNGCTTPALVDTDTTIGQTAFTCQVPYRTVRLLHDYAYTPSPIPNHTIPHSPWPDAPTLIWDFFNSAQ